MKKLAATMMALVLCICMLAGCGGSSGGSSGGSTGGGESGGSGSKEAISATVTVWGPQEDQSDDNGKWLQTQCEAFAKAHPEWTITFKYGVCSEGDAKTNIGTDPSVGADVYLFANDQIPDLLKTGGLAELGGTNVENMKANSSETTVNTVTYNGSVYGFPFTGTGISPLSMWQTDAHCSERMAVTPMQALTSAETRQWQ